MRLRDDETEPYAQIGLLYPPLGLVEQKMTNYRAKSIKSGPKTKMKDSKKVSKFKNYDRVIKAKARQVKVG
jgi:hypothetical protein